MKTGKRNKQIILVVNEDEKEKFENWSDALGLSLASLLRTALIEYATPRIAKLKKVGMYKEIKPEGD